MKTISLSPKALFEDVSFWLKKIQTRRELHSLSDNILADIGIERSHIDDVVDNIVSGAATDENRTVAVVTPLPKQAIVGHYDSRSELPAAA